MKMVAWLHGFIVAWLHCCMVAWLHGCIVAWLHGTKIIAREIVECINHQLNEGTASYRHALLALVSSILSSSKDDKQFRDCIGPLLYRIITSVLPINLPDARSNLPLARKCVDGWIKDRLFRKSDLHNVMKYLERYESQIKSSNPDSSSSSSPSPSKKRKHSGSNSGSDSDSNKNGTEATSKSSASSIGAIEHDAMKFLERERVEQKRKRLENSLRPENESFEVGNLSQFNELWNLLVINTPPYTNEDDFFQQWNRTINWKATYSPSHINKHTTSSVSPSFVAKHSSPSSHSQTITRDAQISYQVSSNQHPNHSTHPSSSRCNVSRHNPQFQSKHDQIDRPSSLSNSSSFLQSPAQSPTSLHLKKNKKRIFIWDLEETLIILDSLVEPKLRARYQWKHPHIEELGRSMEILISYLCESFMFIKDIGSQDQMHINAMSEYDDMKDLKGYNFSNDQSQDGRLSYQKLAYRYRHIKQAYDFRRKSRLQLLAQYSQKQHQHHQQQNHIVESQSIVTIFSQSKIDPKEMVTWHGLKGIFNDEKVCELERVLMEIDILTNHWLTLGKEVAKLSSTIPNGINVLISNGRLIPTLAKCMVYGLHPFFPVDNIFSSALPKTKKTVFEHIQNRFGTDSEYWYISNSIDEQNALNYFTPSTSFHFKISKLNDLKNVITHLESLPRTSLFPFLHPARMHLQHPTKPNSTE